MRDVPYRYLNGINRSLPDLKVMNRFTSVCLSVFCYAKHKTLTDLLHLISVRTMTACHWPKPATLVISIIDMYTMISMANAMLATLSISMAYAMLATLAKE